MRRSELEHLLRAAGAITNQQVFIVVGSQAILASLEDPPSELTVSLEADLYPRDAPHLADLLDGSIGELSPFHETFGYYAHGVGPETAILAPGWEQRLVPLRNENTRGVTGLCLSPEDLGVSKLAAGRDKDLAFVRAMLERGVVRPAQLRELVRSLAEPHSGLATSRLEWLL